MGKKEDITQPMASQCILHILFGLLCQLFSSEIFHTQIVIFFLSTLVHWVKLNFLWVCIFI